MEPEWGMLREGDVVYLEGEAGGPVQLRVGPDALYPQEYPTVFWDHAYLPLGTAQRMIDAGDATLRKKYDAAANKWRH